MSADERLVFLLCDDPKTIIGTGYKDVDLLTIPTDTVYLCLENSQVTDEGIANLPSFINIRCIDLDSTLITDAALKKLSGFASLEELWLEDTAITDQGVRFLYPLKKLKFLSILDCDISHEAIKKLQDELPGLKIH